MLNTMIEKLTHTTPESRATVTQLSEQVANVIGADRDKLAEFVDAYHTFSDEHHATLSHIMNTPACDVKQNTSPKTCDSIDYEALAHTFSDPRNNPSSQELVDVANARGLHALADRYCSDMPAEDGAMLIMRQYRTAQQLVTKGGNAEKAWKSYMHALQGLSMMDIDPYMYAVLSSDPNTMGRWLPALTRAVERYNNRCGDGAVRIPTTIVAQVPLPLLQLSRLDYAQLSEEDHAIVNAWARQTFHLDHVINDPHHPGIVIKTGTFSSKYDARNCIITDKKEIAETGSYLTYIAHQAAHMASPLGFYVDENGKECMVEKPSIPGVSCTNEYVVRDYIPDNDHNPTIYHGLPLRCEVRAFIDLEKDDPVMGIVPYWDKKMMVTTLDENASSGDVDAFYDATIVRAHTPILMEIFEKHRHRLNTVVRGIAKELQQDTSGDRLSTPSHTPGNRWSLDIMITDTCDMENKNHHVDAVTSQLWVIDMAQAYSSAFYDIVVPRSEQRWEDTMYPWSVRYDQPARIIVDNGKLVMEESRLFLGDMSRSGDICA